MNTDQFLIKIKSFYDSLDEHDKIFNTEWIAGNNIGVSKFKTYTKDILDNISNNDLTFGTNLEEYHNHPFWKNKENMIGYHNIQHNLLTELTDINMFT